MMKKFTFFILLLALSFNFSCSNDNLTDNSESNETFNFTVTESTVHNLYSRTSDTLSCTVKTLIAGQHMEAGTVEVTDINSEYIEIVFKTNEDWNIDLTHLSLGNCNDQWVPTTGSGNPKVGKFEHTEPHDVQINQVTYQIGVEHIEADEDGNYCFAAHAEVSSTTGGGGETAWAQDFLVNENGEFVDENGNLLTPDDEGNINPVERSFEGNNWAMYVEANVSDCDIETDGTQTGTK